MGTMEPVSGLLSDAAKMNNASVNSDNSGSLSTSSQCSNNANSVNGVFTAIQKDDSLSKQSVSIVDVEESIERNKTNAAGASFMGTLPLPSGDMTHSVENLINNPWLTQTSPVRFSQRIRSKRSSSVGTRSSTKSKLATTPKKRAAGNLPGVSNQTTNLIKKSIPKKAFQPIPTSAVTVSNRFEALGLEQMDVTDIAQTSPDKVSRPRGPTPTAKTPRPPPLTLTNHQGKEVDKLLYDSGVNLAIKLTAAGTRVFPAEEKGRQQLVDLLKSNQIPFFTHPPKSAGVLRVILKGLPTIDTKDIKDDITSRFNVTPTSIRPITTNKYAAIYSVEFSKSTVSLKKLQEIVTDILHYRVKWESPRTKPAGPTICRRCAMLGHGMSNCFRAPVCLNCAGEHVVDECPFNSQAEENNTLALCCVNCKARGFHSNHRADDAGCRTRAQYMELRNTMPNKRNVKPPSQQAAHWPSLANKRQSSAKNTANVAKTANQGATPHNFQPNGPAFQRNLNPVFTNTSYAEAVTGDRHNRHSNQTSSELFTADEIINITLNAIDQIQACNSKLEQLRIVAQLLSKCI